MSTRILLKPRTTAATAKDVAASDGPTFLIDIASQELLKDGVRLKFLLGHTYLLLKLLIEKAPSFATYAEIEAALWPGRGPMDPQQAIREAMGDLRALFCDTPKERKKARFFENVPTKGYRFVGMVLDADALSPPQPVTAQAGTLVPRDPAPENEAAPTPPASNPEPPTVATSAPATVPAGVAIPAAPARSQWRRLTVPVLLVLLALAALIAWRLKPGAFGELRQDLVWHGPSADRMGDVSRDGRFLCFTDPDSEQLRVRDLKSGKSWMVTSKPAQSRAGGARNCTWSPDGRWIAYQKDMGDRLEVRSVSIKGLEDRLLTTSRDTTVFFPGDWSADGSRVAIVACLPDQTRLSEIDHSSGAAVRTYRLAGCPNVARLSADGDWLAHDLRDNAPSGAIHVVSTKTSSSQAIASGRVGLVDWTPDGRGLVYTASSSATDVVVAPIREGRLAGDSLSLVKALGPARPIAITGAGDFYYALRTGHPATYIAEIDARNQKCLRAASRMDAPESIQPVQADWTPDGQAISFVRWFDGTAVYTRQGNSLAMLVPKLDRVSLATIRWSPDGGSLLAAAGGENYVIGLYRIHRNDGSVQPLRRSHDLSTFYYDPIQSAFNGAVYYKLRRYMVEPSRLFEMFPNSDRPDREVIPSVYSFALSRDGRLLVYSSFDARDEFIRILDLASGATTELHREKRQGRIVSVAFTPDSQFVLYAQRGQLWRLPAAGGAPAMLPLNMEGMRDLRPHPDGRRLAFSAGTRDMSDLWVMRNAFSR